MWGKGESRDPLPAKTVLEEAALLRTSRAVVPGCSIISRTFRVGARGGVQRVLPKGPWQRLQFRASLSHWCQSNRRQLKERTHSDCTFG